MFIQSFPSPHLSSLSLSSCGQAELDTGSPNNTHWHASLSVTTSRQTRPAPFSLSSSSSSRLCPSTAGCSPPSMSSIVFCLLLSCFTFHLGFVHPLQDAALHQCLPSSSVCCFPNPGGSLLLCYVILPSSAWSSSRPLPSPWLPLCASPCPPIVL